MPTMMHKSFKQFTLPEDGGKGIPSPADMKAIHKLALEEFKPEDFYVRRFLACHNLVDRTGDRFTEKALDEMATTLHAKAFSVSGHPGWTDSGPQRGRIFKTETQKMSIEEFNALTGEDEALPPGVKNVKVVWAHAYMLRSYDGEKFNTEIIGNIQAGIYTFVSVGFNAKRAPVEGEGKIIQYYELDSPCDGLELSLVWLGAQQGATAKHYRPESKKDMGSMIEDMESHCKAMDAAMKEMKNHCDEAMALCGKMKSEMEGMDDAGKGQAVPPLATPCEPSPAPFQMLPVKILNLRR